MSERRTAPPIAVAGIILLILGIILLLNTTSVVSWGIWFRFFQFWPLALIAVGLHIILAPRFPILSAAISAATVVIIIAVGIVAPYISDRDSEGPLSAASRQSWSSYDTETLDMEIHFGAGSLTLHPNASSNPDEPSAFPSFITHGVDTPSYYGVDMRTGPDLYSNPGELELFTVRASGIDAVINSVPDEKVAPSWRVAGRNGRYRLVPVHPVTEVVDKDVSVIISPGPSDGGRGDIDPFGLLRGLGSADWEVTISPDVVLSLNIEAGAADINLNLSQLALKTLDIDVGAADVYMILPARAGHSDVRIDAGAADIEISIPDHVSALIESDSTLSSLNVDTSRFPGRDGVYRSPNYDTAQNRVRINIDAGVSDISIN